MANGKLSPVEVTISSSNVPSSHADVQMSDAVAEPHKDGGAVALVPEQQQDQGDLDVADDEDRWEG
jgi:hypothetical protein